MTRLVGIDVARCLALLGMVATHTLDQRTATGDLTWSHAVAGGRASALFAVLAGLSIALTAGRGRPVHGTERAAVSVALVVRAGLIALIGLILAEMDTGIAVILTYYGVLFVGALPFLGLSARALFVWAAGWLVVAPVVSQALRPWLPERGWSSPTFGQLAHPETLLPELLFTGYYPVVTWMAYLLVGLAVGRLELSRRGVAAALALGGGALALVATWTSDMLTRVPAVVSGLLADPAQLGSPQPRTRSEVLDQTAGGMFGTTPSDAWPWLLVRAPHSGTPFDLAQTIGSALLVIGAALFVVGLVPGLGERTLAVLFGAGTATLTIYSLHIALRTDLLGGWVEPETFIRHVLVLGALGSALVAIRRRGPLEAAMSAAARRSTTLVRGPEA